MALSTEELLKLRNAEHQALKVDMVRTLKLLDYYRNCVHEDNGSRAVPPSGYWVKPGPKGFAWGVLSDGTLQPLGGVSLRAGGHEDAIKACWDHYDKLHNDVRKIQREKKVAKGIPQREPEDDLDLSDLEEDEPQPVRKSRRRKINE